MNYSSQQLAVDSCHIPTNRACGQVCTLGNIQRNNSEIMKHLCDTYIINISEIISEKITMIKLRWKQLAAAARVRSVLSAKVSLLCTGHPNTSLHEVI